MTISKMLITGTRDPDASTLTLLRFALNWVASSAVVCPNPLLLHGAARGIDLEAKMIWNELGLKDRPFEANWTEYGKAAGGIRNQEMVDESPQICLALPSPSSKGTWDAVRRAKQAGVKTFVLTDKDSMYKLYYYTILKPGETVD